MQGIVKWWDGKKGYGFIQANGLDHFVHHTAISRAPHARGPRNLTDGEQVLFEPIKTDKGYKALNVRSLEPGRYTQTQRRD